ncbi:MAG: hypothetical protein LH615_13440 [Ferruginibacter sp.]|nr:hypothetical protein [Ferruginibacter sp.]
MATEKRFGLNIISLRFYSIKINCIKNPDVKDVAACYRLVESYRNGNDRVCRKTLLGKGFGLMLSVNKKK